MKPAPELTYSFEARIELLHSSLSAYTIGGGYLSPGQARNIVNELEHLKTEAAAIREELSAKRWNGRGSKLSNLVHRQVREGNVALLPVVARPVPKSSLQQGDKS